jgi:hypothetical protein
MISVFAFIFGLMLGCFAAEFAFSETLKEKDREIERLDQELWGSNRQLERTSELYAECKGLKTGSISHESYGSKLSNLRMTKALENIYKISAERLPRIVCRRDEDTVSQVFKLANEALYPNGKKEDKK